MNPVIDGPQQLMRLWGEEQQDDAIYTVYLKKVRYHPRSNIQEDAVAHLEWETIRIKIVKAGTLEKLVENLITDTGELESTYINIFFSTYRSFATPSQILTLLLDRYSQFCENKITVTCKNKESHKITLGNVLLLWIDVFSEDFFDPPQFLLLHQLLEFTELFLPNSVLEIRVKQKLEALQQCKRKESFNTSIPVPCYELSLNSAAILHLNFLEIPEEHMAKQLTLVDAKLFKDLIPHHCLGSVWSGRGKAKVCRVKPFTVSATVNQFNAVSLRVMSTILSNPSMKSYLRSKIILKWIKIAQELRFLKNFSSLKAIMAALQSNAIYRLKKVWLMVPNDKIDAFLELAQIFSEDNNQVNCRNLLIKEGSAKFADTVGCGDKKLQKALHKHFGENNSTMQGTVPYLGTFLTDLTMIDTALPDLLPNGFINFDKRRKEFEVIAQIKLLQSAANNYDISEDKDFQSWFYSLSVLDDAESYELSCLIEPVESCVSEKKHILQKLINSTQIFGHKKSDSTSSTSSSCSQFYDHTSNDSQAANNSSNDCASGERLSKSCSNLSSILCSQALNDGKCNLREFYVIKVSLEENNNDSRGVNLYKSIILSNKDHTRTVIINALAKHGITDNPDKYVLVQLVPGGEITFPDSANVFYAVNATYDLNFLLKIRPKNENIKKCKPQLMKRFLSSIS